LYHSKKGFQLILILLIQQALVKGITSANKETVMKIQETFEKKINIVYRKDGKTPDLRYKSLRNHVLSQPLEKNTNPPVQIQPTGKKPVWKISN